MSRQRFDAPAFRRRLATVARTSGLKNPTLADVCSMPVSTLEMYLYTETLPGARALFNLAQGLNVSVDWLLFGGRDMGRAPASPATNSLQS